MNINKVYALSNNLLESYYVWGDPSLFMQVGGNKWELMRNKITNLLAPSTIRHLSVMVLHGFGDGI